MSRSAQRIYTDFVRFAAEEAGSLYCEQLLRGDVKDWPPEMRRRFPALATWQGISHLKRKLKCLAEASGDSQLLLTSRSAQLMRLAARLLMRVCSNVLVADLNWPSYQRILNREVSSTANRLTCARIKSLILDQGVGVDDLIEHIVRTCVENKCDGLFLPAVDNLGIRLPVERIVQTVEQQCEIRFVVVDGAQAFYHIPVRLMEEYCDFFIAGSHKWLGGFHPMGCGFYGRLRSRRYIDDTKHRMTDKGELDDPLLNFTEEIEQQSTTSFGETVVTAPLFTCEGATSDAVDGEIDLGNMLSKRMMNANTVRDCFANSRWKPIVPNDGFRSGILLFQSTRRSIQAATPNVVRTRFNKAGVVVTTYDKGLVRMSMPPTSLSDSGLDQISAAFAACA